MFSSYRGREKGRNVCDTAIWQPRFVPGDRSLSRPCTFIHNSLLLIPLHQSLSDALKIYPLTLNTLSSARVFQLMMKKSQGSCGRARRVLDWLKRKFKGLLDNCPNKQVDESPQEMELQKLNVEEMEC